MGCVGQELQLRAQFRGHHLGIVRVLEKVRWSDSVVVVEILQMGKIEPGLISGREAKFGGRPVRITFWFLVQIQRPPDDRAEPNKVLILLAPLNQRPDILFPRLQEFNFQPVGILIHLLKPGRC